MASADGPRRALAKTCQQPLTVGLGGLTGCLWAPRLRDLSEQFVEGGIDPGTLRRARTIQAASNEVFEIFSSQRREVRLW